ncbi:hypothetical protein VTJ83DRAFT_3147 [Remersonia thermophila]|uniref:Uncharacterized protein n=1 Tax=Remersonia thermophila TaxID=72144 RepID=A0ABR4DD74_9PEZI
MVLLTVTPSIVEGLQKLGEANHGHNPTTGLRERSDELLLEDAAIGNPIPHSKIVDIWKSLQTAGHKDYDLEALLKGSMVYVPPPPPKPQQTDEYKALMERLRREQEQREYERMKNPAPPMETFLQRFPNSADLAQSFAAVNRPGQESDVGDDEVTYSDVHRQLMLILNFVASILGVAATLWVLARWWSTPARIFLTLGGSILVGIAEVAVYSGYVWHLGQAKKQEVRVKEVKEIVETWMVGAEEDVPLANVDGAQKGEAGLRRRQRGEK